MKQAELVVTTRIDKAKDSPELQNVLDTQLSKIYQEKVESEKLNSTRTKEILKAIRDTTLETVSLVAQANSVGGIIGGLVAEVLLEEERS
ncbi:hypothetical protein [Rickettsia honei]|uniref:hypothetical protein n=1 Tax=Rickettsia honei TaxID=37816 RepID=UPI0002D90DEB|nr:hypothetical protein [Rickettsia honei]